MAKQLLVRNKACMSCMIGCARVTKLADPRYKAQTGEGPEYETIFALGSDCGVSDLSAITKANYLCNEYGMDPISAGATVACAMEMFEKGIIPQSDIGMPLKFGDADALVKMIELTGKREGFGDKLALGSYRLASLYGHPEFSMSVKKQEFPAYDGRVAQGMALEYATSNRGACHVRGYMISPEIMGVPEKLDPYATENKAFWTKTFQDVTAVVDSVGMCLFTTFAININHITNLFTAATGLDYTQDDMMKAGERIYNIERLFNLKAGIDPSQDTLPKRILEEPVKQGPAKGMVAKLSVLLPEYYKERGWGSDGIPTQEKLKELNIA
jgi:aldehyde:ferredoxin oxidoreductase